MEQSPPWEANRVSVNQEIPRILWNPKVHYRIHKCPLPVPILSQLDPVPILEDVLILYSHLRLGLPSGLFLSGFPTKPCIHLSSPIRATCTAHLILLDLTTRTIFGEQYKSLSSSLCSFLHSPVTTPLLDPNILLHTLFSNTLSLRSSLSVSDQVSHPYKTTHTYIPIITYSENHEFVPQTRQPTAGHWSEVLRKNWWENQKRQVQESNNKNWIRNNSSQRNDKISTTEIVWWRFENGGWEGPHNGRQAGTQGKRPKGRTYQTWRRKDTERGTEWKGVRAMTRDSNRWKTVCTPSVPNSKNKRLDYVQQRHATPPDC